MLITVLAEKSGWHTDDLARAAAAAGHELRLQPWTSLAASVAAPATDAFDQLRRSDAVLLRTMPAGSLEQVVFRMDLLHRLEAEGMPMINPPHAIECAVDKYLSLARIEAAGISVPATVACQTFNEARIAFDQLGGDVILKPLFGSEGFGMTRISDPALAGRAFAQLERQRSVIYLQQFIHHSGSDSRLFVLNGQVIASMQRIAPGWRTNISSGGHAMRCEPDEATIDLAIRATEACGCVMGGVDVIESTDGEQYVLEVNAVPGWRTIGTVTGIDFAARIIEEAERLCSESVNHSTPQRPQAH